jgi:opacity protein-like surface antigen
MKRTILVAIAIAILASAAFADLTYPALAPKNAASMALGGSFTSIPTAEFSFFGNPAAFAAKKGSLTLLSTDAWAYVKPTSDNMAALSGLEDEGSNPAAVAGGLMPTNNGIGGGASFGLGYAGRGLGIGFFAVSDNWAEGDSVPGAVINSDTQVSAVVGLGIPLQLGDSIRLAIGGDLRPFYRVRSSFPLADAIDGLENITDINAGFGLAMDLGASLQLGSLGLGLAIRDIAPPFPIWHGDLATLQSSLEQGSLPDAGEGAEKAVFLPSITAGLSWKPKLIPGLIDPAVYFELQDPVAVFQNAEGLGSMLNLTHLGAEVQFLRILTLRAGLNRGWLSVGGGIDLLFLDVDAAVFTEELGALPGDKPRSGFSFSFAVRF